MSELDQPVNSLEGMSPLQAEMTKRGMETRLVHDLEAALRGRCNVQGPLVVIDIINGINAKQGCERVLGLRSLPYWAGYYHAYLLQQNVSDYNYTHIDRLYDAIGDETTMTGFISVCEQVSQHDDEEEILFDVHDPVTLVTYIHQALISGIPLRRDYVYRTYTRTILHGIGLVEQPMTSGLVKRLVRFIDQQYEIVSGNHSDVYRRGHLNGVVLRCAEEDEPMYYYMLLVVFCVLQGELKGFSDPSDEADLIRVAGYVGRDACRYRWTADKLKDFEDFKRLFVKEQQERFAMNVMRFVGDL